MAHPLILAILIHDILRVFPEDQPWSQLLGLARTVDHSPCSSMVQAPQWSKHLSWVWTRFYHFAMQCWLMLSSACTSVLNSPDPAHSDSGYRYSRGSEQRRTKLKEFLGIDGGSSLLCTYQVMGHAKHCIMRTDQRASLVKLLDDICWKKTESKGICVPSIHNEHTIDIRKYAIFSRDQSLDNCLASCVLHKMRPRKEWITTGLASCLCTLFGESFVLFIRIVLLAVLVVWESLQ
jgi:hypothetical protein